MLNLHTENSPAAPRGADQRETAPRRRAGQTKNLNQNPNHRPPGTPSQAAARLPDKSPGPSPPKWPKAGPLHLGETQAEAHGRGTPSPCTTKGTRHTVPGSRAAPRRRAGHKGTNTKTETTGRLARRPRQPLGIRASHPDRATNAKNSGGTGGGCEIPRSGDSNNPCPRDPPLRTQERRTRKGTPLYQPGTIAVQCLETRLKVPKAFSL